MCPFYPSHIVTGFLIIKEIIDADVFNISTFFHFQPPTAILAATKKGQFSILIKDFNIGNTCSNLPGQNSLSKQFEAFDVEIYYCIMASLVFISFVISLYKRSLKSFFTTLWSYASVILSDYYTIRLNKSIDRFISGVWLITCTILLAAFSGQLREQQMKPQPIFWIDSIEDLWQWKDLKIETNVLTDFFHRVLNVDYNDQKTSDIAYDLIGRLELLNLDKSNFNNKSLIKKLFDAKSISDGKIALIYSQYYLQVLKKILFEKSIEEDIDFHLSRRGDYQPLFTIFNIITCNQTIANVWNYV